MTKNVDTGKAMKCQGQMGLFFVLTYIGAAVYFVKVSVGFWGFIGALLKAAVWPAVVIYHVLLILKA